MQKTRDDWNNAKQKATETRREVGMINGYVS